MKTENVAIDSLMPDLANARRHGKRNLEALKSSLQRFGQQKPIVVDSRNIVRAGNGALAAARALGWTNIEIVRSDLPLSELTAYAIADNRSAELAEWDDDVLSALAADGLLDDVGFDARDLTRLTGADEFEEHHTPDAFNHTFELVIECNDEAQQKQLFERLSSEGFSCRLFTL